MYTLNTREHLQRQYYEAYVCNLTQKLWRRQLAHQLYRLAKKLEPQTKVGGQVKLS